MSRGDSTYVFQYINCFFCVSVAFRMYDLDGDNQISKEEVLAVLTMMVSDNDNISEEQLKNIAEQTIKECGHSDRMIDFDEFCEAMEKCDVETKMAIRLK